MTTVITAIAGVARESLKLVNTKAARDHVDAISRIEKQILEEDSRGYDSDDAKIERLKKELQIELEAYRNEIALFAARGAGGV